MLKTRKSFQRFGFGAQLPVDFSELVLYFQVLKMLG